MPPELIWQDSWAIGIERMDADHREMLRLLNLFFAASHGRDNSDPEADDPPTVPTRVGSEPVSLIQRLDDVLEHLRVHFAREENFLQSIGYPSFDEHRSEHALEMAELIELRRELLDRPNQPLDEESAAGIKRWFFNHVIAEDRRYAAYYFAHVDRDAPGTGNQD
jgi:hemerythrin